MSNVSMTPEQLQQLVSSLTTAALQAVEGAKAKPTSSFSGASFSYDGARDPMRVEEFLSAASVYKSVNNISDTIAVKSLPLILKGDASMWWQGVKDSINDWKDFEKRLRHAFAPKKSGVVIFQELFAQKQADGMLTESFIARSRSLLSQLPSPGLTEELQLDAVYGQLNISIRKKIQRDSVKTFDELLSSARNVEHLMREDLASAQTEEQSQFKKQRCNYCRGTGHVTEECRKRLKDIRNQSTTQGTAVKTEIAATQAPSPSRPVFSCYGCGAPGVTRNKCLKCQGAQPVKTEERVEFCAISAKTDARPRPLVTIGIFDVVGTAFIDTCAKSSVASYQLYEYLKRRKCHFIRQTVTVTMADGIKKREDILSVTVPVKLCDRVIPTTFIVLPKARENRTLLGVGFIEDSGLIPNLSQRSFSFVDQPVVSYNMAVEEMEGISLAHFESNYSVGLRRPPEMVPQVADLPEPSTSAKRSRQIFDGYIPSRTDFMFADAVQSIEEAEVYLPLSAQTLFPDHTDIGLNAFNIREFRTELSDEKQKKPLLGVLEANEEVCLPGMEPTTFVDHRINTQELLPIAVPPYRLSPARKESKPYKLSEWYWCRGRPPLTSQGHRREDDAADLNQETRHIVSYPSRRVAFEDRGGECNTNRPIDGADSLLQLANVWSTVTRVA